MNILFYVKKINKIFNIAQATNIVYNYNPYYLIVAI